MRVVAVLIALAVGGVGRDGNAFAAGSAFF